MVAIYLSTGVWDDESIEIPSVDPSSAKWNPFGMYEGVIRYLFPESNVASTRRSKQICLRRLGLNSTTEALNTFLERALYPFFLHHLPIGDLWACSVEAKMAVTDGGECEKAGGGGGGATCQASIGAHNVCGLSGHVLVDGDSLSAHQ